MPSRIASVILASLTIAVTAACTPAGPASVLPPGVSVEWERDTGGVTDAIGNYTPAWATTYVSSTITLGPVAGGVKTPMPTEMALGSGYIVPDGTAKFPWNGYAGESVSLPGPPGSVNLIFPTGGCTIAVGVDDRLQGVSPSPDGSKAGVLIYNIESDTRSTVEIIALAPTPGGDCHVITSASYLEIGSGSSATGSSVTNPAFVWNPDSSAIVYQEDPGPNQYLFGPASIDRLDAAPAAAPTTVIPATPLGTHGCRTPLGWSVADRLLVSCWYFPLVAPLTITSTLETLPAAGGSRRVLDTATLRRQVSSDFELYDHYGYFIPSTDTVIYNSGAVIGGSSGGPTFPAFQIRVIADQPSATSAPFAIPVPALHIEAQAGTVGPGYTAVLVPNADLVDRFGH